MIQSVHITFVANTLCNEFHSASLLQLNTDRMKLAPILAPSVHRQTFNWDQIVRISLEPFIHLYAVN